MVQVPTETTVTVVPDTVQTPDVAVVKATVKPEVEIADRLAGVSPTVISDGAVKVTVCDAFEIAKDWTTWDAAS